MVDLIPGSVGVVVVNYGSSALLAANLVPLGRSMPEARVVVVDNLTSAEERSAVIALAEAEGWSVELPDSNTGFGVGVNLGAVRALGDGADWLLILNPDATI